MGIYIYTVYVMSVTSFKHQQKRVFHGTKSRGHGDIMWNYMELWDFKINLICAMVKIHGIYACGSTVIIPGMVGMSSPLSIWMAFMGLNFCSIPYIYTIHIPYIYIYIQLKTWYQDVPSII